MKKTLLIDGFVPSALLSAILGIESKYVRSSNLTKIKFKNIILVQIPKEALKYIDTHSTTLIRAGESEEGFDYVLTLSKRIRVGFWR